MKELQLPKQNKIYLLGVELEGGWDNCPRNFQDDGSVECAGDTTGECISDPQKLPSLLKWIPQHYPDYTNDTCGFHVHTSYNEMRDYETLMERKFYDFFLARFAKWGKSYPIRNTAFWARLEGKNTYCRKVFEPLKQAFISYKGVNRYTHLNYCWGLHGTLECRLFPMFKSSKTAQAAVCELVDLIETYLVMNRPHPLSIVSNFVPVKAHATPFFPVNKIKAGTRFPQKSKIELSFEEFDAGWAAVVLPLKPKAFDPLDVP